MAGKEALIVVYEVAKKSTILEACEVTCWCVDEVVVVVTVVYAEGLEDVELVLESHHGSADEPACEHSCNAHCWCTDGWYWRRVGWRREYDEVATCSEVSR